MMTVNTTVQHCTQLGVSGGFRGVLPLAAGGRKGRAQAALCCKNTPSINVEVGARATRWRYSVRSCARAKWMCPLWCWTGIRFPPN